MMVPAILLDEVARRFRLLGEPARLELLNYLQTAGEAPVQDLVGATGQSQPNVSKHLRLMLEAGLVARRQEGLFAYYRIADPTVSALCLLVCGGLRSGQPPTQPVKEAPCSVKAVLDGWIIDDESWPAGNTARLCP